MPKRLIGMAVVRAAGAFLMFAALFFLPAWTLKYWQAWIFLAVYFVPTLFVVVYFLKANPDFLIRRMNMKEKMSDQKLIIKLSFIPMSLAFLLPGFDVRLGWSQLPAWISLVADLLVLAGYVFIILVFRENNYASRVIEVSEGQKVIETGPYRLVRHPMYFGVIVMYTFSPLALGSAWAVIPALFMIPMLVARIIGEERVLSADLTGYTEYAQKVRYRLFPGLW